MEEKIIDKELAKMIFGGSEEMYRKYLFQLAERDLFGKMEESLAQGDVKKAFETAHTMKGLVQNLALADYGEVLGRMVEVMRTGEMPTQELRDKVRKQYEKILAYLDHIKENDVQIFE